MKLFGEEGGSLGGNLHEVRSEAFMVGLLLFQEGGSNKGSPEQ